MNRNPPADVRRALRFEVGFGCPVEGCGNPYLEWHHFAPPWHVCEHHNVDGMIALCRNHHPEADAGAFTDEQFKEMKERGKSEEIAVQGRFNWMRRAFMVNLGTDFCLNMPIILSYGDYPVVWFSRNANGYLLLNLEMLTGTCEPRLSMRNNDWVMVGSPKDFECPPSGRLIDARYANGDRLRLEFSDISNADDFEKRYHVMPPSIWSSAFPLTVIDFIIYVEGGDISINSKSTIIGNSHSRGNFMSNAPGALKIKPDPARIEHFSRNLKQKTDF